MFSNTSSIHSIKFIKVKRQHLHQYNPLSCNSLMLQHSTMLLSNVKCRRRSNNYILRCIHKT